MTWQFKLGFRNFSPFSLLAAGTNLRVRKAPLNSCPRNSSLCQKFTSGWADVGQNGPRKSGLWPSYLNYFLGAGRKKIGIRNEEIKLSEKKSDQEKNPKAIGQE
jgi:hypothetical protein